MSQKSQIPLDELKSFYSTDRLAYARLVISLQFDPANSRKIVAFWNRLERIYCFRNFVKNLEKLSDSDLYLLAYEALNCFYYMDLYKEEEYLWIRLDVPMMEKLANQVISLGLIFPQKESMNYISNFANTVLENVFDDIVPRSIPLVEEIQDLDLNRFQDPEHNRTLFVTFSKGHPVSKQEVQTLLTRKYGDIVESIYIRNEDMFARVVLNSVADVKKVLENNSIVKLSYTGKDVWVRKYVDKFRNSVYGTKLV